MTHTQLFNCEESPAPSGMFLVWRFEVVRLFLRFFIILNIFEFCSRVLQEGYNFKKILVNNNVISTTGLQGCEIEIFELVMSSIQTVGIRSVQK